MIPWLAIVISPPQTIKILGISLIITLSNLLNLWKVLPGSVLFHANSKPSWAVLLSDRNHRYSIFCVETIWPFFGNWLPQNLWNIVKYWHVKKSPMFYWSNFDFKRTCRSCATQTICHHESESKNSDWIANLKLLNTLCTNTNLLTCSQSKRHSRESSKLNLVNVTFSTLSSSVLMSHAHLELSGYVFATGNFSVPLNVFRTPPQARTSNWQLRPFRFDGHTQRYWVRAIGMQVPPFWHGFGEHELRARAHLGCTVPGGHSQWKLNRPTLVHDPPFKHGFAVQPSIVLFDAVHPKGP